MYAIYGNIYHQYTPVMLAYIYIIYHTWTLWGIFIAAKDASPAGHPHSAAIHRRGDGLLQSPGFVSSKSTALSQHHSDRGADTCLKKGSLKDQLWDFRKNHEHLTNAGGYLGVRQFNPGLFAWVPYSKVFGCSEGMVKNDGMMVGANNKVTLW